MSNSKRYSGEKDAFDKRAEELRAMLAESRRWLVEVELGDAEAEAGRVSSRPPSHVAEELYSPGLWLQQQETARELAAVQEKTGLEEAIVPAQQLLAMQKEAFQHKDGVQETIAAVLAKSVRAAGCGSSRMFECPRKFTQEPKYLSPGPMFIAVREPESRAVDQGAKKRGQEGCPARTLMEAHVRSTAQSSARSGRPIAIPDEMRQMRTGSGSSTGERELMPPPDEFELAANNTRRRSPARTPRPVEHAPGGAKRTLFEPPSTQWGGGIGSWRQMQLPGTNRSSPQSMSPEQIRATEERTEARRRLLVTESSRPISVQPVLTVTGPLVPETRGSPADANALKAKDWTRMHQEMSALLAENARLRQSLGDRSISREEMQDHISRIVELEEENACLKADVDRLTIDNNLLLDVAKEMRDMRNERLLRGENKVQGQSPPQSPPPVDDKEMIKLRHENEKLLASWDQARKAQALLENDLADLKTILQREVSQNDQSRDALITLVLRTDFSRAGVQGSKERENFKEMLLQDLSRAVGIPSSDFGIKDIRGGSIVAEVAIRKSATCPAPMLVARDLEKQAYAPASNLCKGVLTRDLEVIMVSSADQLPVDAPTNDDGIKDKMKALENERDDLNRSLRSMSEKCKMLEEELASCRDTALEDGNKYAEMVHCSAELRELQDSSQAPMGLLKADNDEFRAENAALLRKIGQKDAEMAQCNDTLNVENAALLQKLEQKDAEMAKSNAESDTELREMLKQLGEAHYEVDRLKSELQALPKGRIGMKISADPPHQVLSVTELLDPTGEDLNQAVQIGDELCEVDGVHVETLPVENVLQRVSGPAGSLVRMGLKRNKTGERYDIVVLRHLPPGSAPSQETPARGNDVDLAKKLVEHEHKMAELSGELRKIMEEKDSAIALCNAAARTSHECDRELREMLKQVDEVQQESRTAKEEAENLRSELQAKSAQDRANISSLQGQVDRLSELLAEAKLKDDEKSNVVSSLTGEIQKLQRELGKKSEQTVKLQIELSETGRLLEILEGKAGLQANRLTEMQEILDSKSQELKSKDQVLHLKQLQLEETLITLDDCSKELVALQDQLRDAADDQHNLRSELGRQIEEHEALQSELHAQALAQQEETLQAHNMALAISKLQQEKDELQFAMSRKFALETEQAAKIVDLQCSLSRMQTSEQELNAKVSKLQGSIDRERVHQQLVRGSLDDHDQVREQVRAEEKTAREELQRENKYLQMKIYALTDATNSATLKTQESTADLALAYDKMARLERELLSYRQREADARALVEQMNAQSGRESDPLGVDYRGLLPKSPIDNDTIRALERELLSDALKGSNTISSFSRHVHPQDDDPSRATSYDFVGHGDLVEI